MSFNDQRRYKLIEKIKDLINKKLPKDKTQIIIDFTKQFYSSIAVEDLEQRDIEDLYGAILSHWQLISSRKRGETKIRIYNPHYEQHGWQSTHTIIEIVTDDMPFLVDSLRMELNRRGLTTHLIVHFGGMKISRDKLAKATAILPFATPVGDNVVAEAPLYIEIDRQTQAGYLEALKDSLENILKDVRYAVEDWSKMRGKLREALMEIDKKTLSCNPEELSETKDFLRWLENDHFTFLGYREYTVVGKGEEMALSIVPNTGLGVLRGSSTSKSYRAFTSLTPEARKLALSSQILLMSKTNTRATVHRPVYTDYIGIKRFDKDGNLIGERRFIGLYTSVAYHSNPKYIPFVRRKVAMIMKNSGLSPTGHAGKALLNILETYPRDDLFQAPAEELYELAMGVLHLQERKTIRLFARKDIYGRFMSCLVFVPRERFTTELAHAMQGIMQMSFDALEISFSTRFSDSVLAQIHYIVRLDPKSNKTYNLKDIEAKLIEVGRSWQDDLKEHLQDHFGEEKGNELYHKYKSAFPAGYRESFSARTAICDIEHIEASLKSNQLNMSFYHSLEETDKFIRFKLFCPMTPIPLSDALPIFENMGLRVLGERPYLINLLDGKKVWISDFTMIYSGGEVVDIESVKTNFQETFYSVWAGLAENDSFNRLVLSAKLAWREITIIRAIAKYLRQIEFTYSQSYIQDCLNKHAHLAKMLIDFFQYRFNPAKQNNRAAMEAIDTKIKNELDLITLLDEDRIIRIYHEVIHAILRTNYYQTDVEGQAKLYLSFKIEPEKISDLPLPVPMYEIFVYSPRLEGTHLRWAKVARGGIRWSDRREDFRTEILGLMKAQVVKNAVIVPSGAKGGFFPKKLPTNASRDEVMAEVIYCYQTFISALLDLTDNRVGEEIIQPENVISYDETDPYLVVAADKGTATFSDIANEIAARYNYWLKDAFASGGSTGYDHKKIGITARGAWESVKRHFRELNLDIQSQYFSVVGIGDMGGDVFGNGMLLSKHIGLVAAFNHQHIFLDPNPDIEKSYLERQRIFNLTRSSWDDYNRDLLSKGGGIYKRTSKAIKLSSEVKKLLNIKKKDFIVPNDLIKAILRAPVDLL
ncbi:MAG: NAD-glutamate dehydrogenase domain-containing protein, partial [Pseudomonadota bacterium]